jgi:hypothetical protein
MCRTDQGPDFRSRPSVASAFLTSDCEIPNCRAIAEGLTPALKAARTAFSLPVVNEPAPSSARAWRGCGFASAVGFSFAGFSGSRPRRSASVVTAASRASISALSSRFSAPAKSLGKKWRGCEAELSGSALPCGTAGCSGAFAVGGAENRSGVVSADRRVGMMPTMPPPSHRGNGRPACSLLVRIDSRPVSRASARFGFLPAMSCSHSQRSISAELASLSRLTVWT